jgi:hypothetical protein
MIDPNINKKKYYLGKVLSDNYKKGIGASPGAGQGHVVFDTETAKKYNSQKK